MNKKSQIKMGETIAILMIFFILLIMGILFWSRYSQTSSKLKIEGDVSARAITIAQTVTFLPELQCSTQEVIKFNCFDVYKIRAMKSLMMENPDEKRALYYFDILKYSNITVYSIYPIPEQYNIYDKPGNYTGYVTTQVPVAVLDPIAGQYGFGYLQVAVYTQ